MAETDAAPPTPLLIDTDGGVDDIAALWYVLRSPAAELLGCTTTGGNVDAGRAADNIARVLHLAGRGDVPIAPGAPGAFGPHPPLRRASAIHGDDGVGDTGRRPPIWHPDPRPAVDLLAEIVASRPGAVTLLTLGPLTNVARLVEAHPTVVPLVDRLVVMGGTVVAQGNALPVAEANIAHDPSAAARVATAAWARPPLLVGLDVTLKATLGPTELDLLAEERTDAAADLATPLAFYRRLGATFSPAGETPCHDLTAAVVALEPDLVDAPVLPLGVDTGGGLAWGATVVDRRRPFFEAAGTDSVQGVPEGMATWTVALDIDVEAVRGRYRRLFGAED